MLLKKRRRGPDNGDEGDNDEEGRCKGSRSCPVEVVAGCGVQLLEIQSNVSPCLFFFSSPTFSSWVSTPGLSVVKGE